MRKHNFAFIDIETTGLDPKIHEIIEIGVVLTTPSLVAIEEFDIKIKPTHIESADKISLKINHYDPKEWQEAVTLKEGIEFFANKVKDCIMVGHNVCFDFEFLNYAFAETGIENLMHYHKLDTISVAWAKLHREPDLEHFSLRELSVRFGIENERSHSALSDARATFELYKKLMSL